MKETPTMLMLVAVTETELGSVALVIRFFEPEEGAARVQRLARNQIKRRWPKVDLTKVRWHVYEPRTTNAGWPHFVGEADWYG